MQKLCKKSSDPSPSCFTNTWIGQDVVSTTYLAYKWSVAILFLVGLVQSIIQNTFHFLDVEETENVYKYFIYLTNNGRLVACGATALEAVLVTRRWRRERLGQEGIVDHTDGLPPVFKLLWALCNTNYSLAVMITLVYWITLYTPERHFLDFENFSGHLLIALFNVVDIFISNRPWRLLHFVHPIIFGGIFGIFSVIYFLAGGTNYYFEPFVYHIIDWAHPARTTLVMGGVGVFFILCHASFYLLYRVRLVCARTVKKTTSADNAETIISTGLGREDLEC